jgi:DNA-binding beta-propeller fold protein YncE
VDSAGYVYMVDAGHQRVLRYDPDGGFVQRVDWNIGEEKEPLARPVAVAADNRQVYIADRGAGQVLRFRRRD